MKHAPSVAFRRVWSLLLLGGRRGGKSHISCVALVMFAVLTPRARVCAISPTQEETDDREQAFRSLMPRRWYLFRGGGAGKPLQFRLANGARILCLSGHKPRSLNRGRVDFALYNLGFELRRELAALARLDNFVGLMDTSLIMTEEGWRVSTEAGQARGCRASRQRSRRRVGILVEASAAPWMDVVGDTRRRRCLAEFDRVWDALTAKNQGRLLRAIVQRVEVDQPANTMRLVLADLSAEVGAMGVASAGEHRGRRPRRVDRQRTPATGHHAVTTTVKGCVVH